MIDVCFKPAARAFLAVMLCMVMAGCSSPQVRELSDHWPLALPAQATVSHVPFVAQADHECGPAALSMVLASAGRTVPLNQLVDQVYLPDRQGALQVEMLAAPRQHGLVSYQIPPNLTALLTEIAAGHPVVVFQNLSLPVYPVWHYAVVTGYDRAADEILLHSGQTADQRVSFFTFEQLWARGHYWAMLALAPEALPVTLGVDQVGAAIAALERLDPSAANRAYRSALRRWPTDAILLVGLGNSAYQLQDKQAARIAYAQAVAFHPDFADAWHNLAQVLLDLGQREAAKDAIDHAIALGGNRLAQYQLLAKEINAQ